MRPTMNESANQSMDPTGWDRATCDALIGELRVVREAMLDSEARLLPLLAQIDRSQLASAANLAHYLAMRRFDLRRVQERLAWIGVSSLGRAETHVLANVDKALGILHVLAGRSWTPKNKDEPAGYLRGPALLARNAEGIFGPPRADRSVRIMVTLPTEAADDASLVEDLVAAGMDVARINCAHDDEPHWTAMAAQVRGAAQRAGRTVRVLMDLGGPKLRTGPIAPGPAVLKLRPARDAFGRVLEPARLGLRAPGSTRPVDGANAHVGVDADWLAQLEPGDRIELSDARDAARRFAVLRCEEGAALLECARTTYLTPETRLRLRRRDSARRDATALELPAAAGTIRLQRGETLRLVREGLGHGARPQERRASARLAAVSCTLPQALDALRPGERVWFDDGRIGAVVRRRTSKAVELEVTVAREGGEVLRADKGINLPDTRLELPALTDTDLRDLRVVARIADLVGLSFAQSADDVRQLRKQLAKLGVPDLGLMLKIETRRGFEHLPEMLFAAMGARVTGVMIARGDLAVECGYERLAEVQEEILWACEAAHVPVVWATQVLETLARTGQPSRAEITDAAMGVRAECVMLNKGPHVREAIRALDDILRRMQLHQSKKRPLLRALKAWRRAPGSAIR